MKKVRLGKTGLMVSRIGMGGIPIQRPPFDEAVKIVGKAIDLGINFFDTSIGYHDSELRLGKGVAEHRDDVILATKGSWRDKESVTDCINKSLERLGTDHIDLWQFHNPRDIDAYEGLFKPDGPLEAATEAMDEGKIEHIGISLHKLDLALRAVDADVFETIQFPFNMVVREAEEKLIPIASKKDVGFIGMKPFAGGRLTDASLVIKYILQYDNVVPAPGFQSVEEIVEVLSILDGDHVLTEAELQRIDTVRSEVGTRFCRRCGYCMPCPQGVNIPETLGLPVLYNVWPADYIPQWGFVTELIANAENCIGCGECEMKCPYTLPIREMIQENLLYHRQFLVNRK